jgi:3-oxoacyl-[acyl-carrier-protein] synthase III
VLVIGAETFSRILDWNDRTTCVLFGDGAGAIVLEAAEGEGTTADRGVLTAHLRSDGSHKDKLFVDGGPSTTGTVGKLRMEGREVFKYAVGMITDVIEAAFKAPARRGRSRLARAASGQSSHHRWLRKEAASHRKGCHHRRSAWQHIGRVDSARPCDCRR